MRLSLLCFLLASPVFAQNQPNPGSDKSHKATENRTGVPADSATNVDVKHVPDISLHKDPFDYVLIVATVLLVGVGGGQLWIMNKTVAVARDSAMAAMNSQRAWVVTQPAHATPNLVPAIPGVPGAPKHFFAYRIWNAGHTTATDVKAFARYMILKSLDDLPVTPTYGELENFPNKVLIPTDTSIGDHGLWGLKWLEPVPTLWESEIEDFENRKRFLYAYGIVTYKNGIGGTGVTAFGLVYHFPLEGDWKPKGFLAAGPDEYNKST